MEGANVCRFAAGFRFDQPLASWLDDSDFLFHAGIAGRGGAHGSTSLYGRFAVAALMRQAVIGPPPSHGPAPKIEPSHGRNLVLKNASGLVLMTPQQIPKGVAPETNVPVGPPPELATGGGASGSSGSGVPTGVLNSMGDANVIPMPPRPVHHPPISHWMEGNLIHRVQPEYPPLAIQTRTQGQVVLRAVISRGGTIENLQVVSGHPLLVRAALEAVRQWRYRPYVLNGEPVEVETQVTVNFVLSGG